jgi:hypothetical protein
MNVGEKMGALKTGEDPHEETFLALYEFVKILQCPICHNLMDSPSTFDTCGHTFCQGCIRAKLEGKGIVSSACPVCKQPGWKNDLHPNHLFMNAVGHVKRLMSELAQLHRYYSSKKAQSSGKSPKKLPEMVSRQSTLKEDVAVLKAVLELCERTPVRHDDVRNAVVPDSQEESQNLSILQGAARMDGDVVHKRKGASVLKDRNVSKRRSSMNIKKWWSGMHRPSTRRGPVHLVIGDALLRKESDSFVSRFGGDLVIEHEVSRNTTHVIVETDASLLAKPSKVYNEAIAVGCWVVTAAWMEASLGAGVVIEEKNYQVHGHRNSDDSIEWRIPEMSRLRRLAGKKGMFHGMTFQFSSPDDNLARLISLADGKVFDSTVPSSSDQIIGIRTNDVDIISALFECRCVLSKEWVYDSIQRGKTIGREMYLVQE